MKKAINMGDRVRLVLKECLPFGHPQTGMTGTVVGLEVRQYGYVYKVLFDEQYKDYLEEQEWDVYNDYLVLLDEDDEADDEQLMFCNDNLENYLKEIFI